jgi:ubiquinone/menaquinone biosynthesis C-methylase UbiE
MDIPEPKRDPENFEIEHLEQIFPDINSRILDIGCGDGRLTRFFAQNASCVVGTDIEPEKLVIASKSLTEPIPGNVNFTAAEAELMPFADGTFNLAIFSWSL